MITQVENIKMQGPCQVLRVSRVSDAFMQNFVDCVNAHGYLDKCTYEKPLLTFWKKPGTKWCHLTMLRYRGWLVYQDLNLATFTHEGARQVIARTAAENQRLLKFKQTFERS